ncbi:trigger factor [Limibacter armeniacum]|uniref:trigger factor n=1 Tax=Limibacter armeniacum TaxID=466084 RepID=UPI002FE61B37
MEFKFDKKENSYGLLTVQVAESDFLPEFNRRVKEQAQRANFKGFRQGKVPPSLMKKMVGKDLKMDVFNATVGQAVDNYLKENDIKTMFQPMYKGDFLTPEKLDAEKNFTLEFELMVDPEFDYTLDKRVKVKGYELEVTDQDVENTINKLMETYPNQVDAEAVAEGDSVKAVFKAEANDFEKEAVLELDEKVQDEVKKAFIGKKVGEEVSFDAEKVYEDAKRLRLLFGGDKEEASKFTGTFTAKIENISRKETPALDQEFFDKVLGEGKASNEEEFRAELKKIIGEANEPAIDSTLADAIRTKLLDKTSFELPTDLLKKVMNNSNQNKLSDEEIEEKFPSFEEAVRWRVITNKIFADAELKVEHSEVEAAAGEQIQAQMAQFGMADMEEEQLSQFVQNYLTSENGKYFEQTYEQVYNDKLISYVKEKITVDAEKVDLAQFEEILKASMEDKKKK